MSDELKITIVGDAGGTVAGEGGGKSGKGKDQSVGIIKDGIGKFVKSGDMTGMAAAIGGAVGGTVGAAIGSVIGGFLSPEAITSAIVSGMVTAIPMALFGPAAAPLGAAVFLGTKKALDNSEAFQGLKKVTHQGLGAVVDSVIGIGYLLYRKFNEIFGGAFMQFVLSPIDWIGEKIGFSDVFDPIDIDEVWGAGVTDRIKKLDKLGIADLFTIIKEDVNVLAEEDIATPIESYLAGRIDIKEMMYWESWGERIKEKYGSYLRPSLQQLKAFEDLFDGEYEITPDQLKMPEKELKLRLIPVLDNKKGNIWEEQIRRMAIMYDMNTPGDDFDAIYQKLLTHFQALITTNKYKLGTG